jgi:hypothetical protein
LPRDGLLTTTVTGFIKTRGDGLGLTTSRGDLLPSTMAAGFTEEADGVGRRVRFMRVRGTHQQWLPGLAEAGALESASVSDGPR